VHASAATSMSPKVGRTRCLRCAGDSAQNSAKDGIIARFVYFASVPKPMSTPTPIQPSTFRESFTFQKSNAASAQAHTLNESIVMTKPPTM